jgi:iron complex outermembrane receptor protein
VRDRDWAHKDYLQNPQGGWSASGNPHSFLPFGLVPRPRRTRWAPRDLRSAIRSARRSAASPVRPRRACPCATGSTQCTTRSPRRRSLQVYGDYNLDITDSTSLHVEAMYADTEIPIYRTSPSYAALQAPTGFTPAPGETVGGTSPVSGQYFVPRNNPGYVAFLADNPGVFPDSGTNPGALLIANRPFALGGNPFFDNGSSEGPRNYDGFRVSVGLNGDISDSLSWDVAATYMEQNAKREGRDTVVNRYQLALRGLGGPGCDIATGTPGTAAASGTTRSTTPLLVIRSPVRPTRSSIPRWRTPTAT